MARFSTSRLGIFLGAWALGLAIVCLIRVDASIAGILAGVWGVLCYFISRRAGKRSSNESRRAIIAVMASFVILAASILLTRTYYWATWDPIGEAYDDGWGSFPLPDVIDTVVSVPNHHGKVAVVRRTRWGLLSVDAPTPYFVFVHKDGQPESRANLVFRYDAVESAWNVPPNLSWPDTSSLMISVPAGDIVDVTKQRAGIDGLSIKYSLGPQTYARHVAFWQRPFF